MRPRKKQDHRTENQDHHTENRDQHSRRLLQLYLAQLGATRSTFTDAEKSASDRSPFFDDQQQEQQLPDAGY